MQELATIVKITNTLSMNHYPLFCYFLNLNNISRCRGIWKFNNFLISNTDFVNEIKTIIQNFIFSLENDTFLTDQVKLQLLKYEICKFPINFFRKLA